MEPNVNKQELSEALKEFEANYNKKEVGTVPLAPVVPTPGTGGELNSAVQEFENKYTKEEEIKITQKQNEEIDAPKIIRGVIKNSFGLIKNEKQAEYALLAVVIIMFGLSLYFFFSFGNSNTGAPGVPPPMIQPGNS